MSLIGKDTVLFTPLSETSIPKQYEPVIIRMTNASNIVEPENYRETSIDNLRPLLGMYHRYGYAIAVMEYKYDGFNVARPWCFRLLELDGTTSVIVTKTIQLSEVIAWAYLNESK